MGGAPSTTIPESLLPKFLLPISVTLGSINVRRLSSQRRKVSTGGCSKGPKCRCTCHLVPGAFHGSEAVSTAVRVTVLRGQGIGADR